MKFIIILFIISNIFASSKTDGLKYLNSLRQEAGLSPLQFNRILQNAAQNHANYIGDIYKKYKKNLMHDEDNENYPSNYYTGDKSQDRGAYLGYRSLFYSENLSAGHKTIFASIDALMSAIYHRFGFLKNNIDEIGIGVNTANVKYKIYNYDMGNSLLNELCKGYNFEGKGGYVYKVCKDKDLRVEKWLYNSTKNYLSENSPKFVIWPPKNSQNIPPVFFEEHPDPLPLSSVSGYPISIEFNKYYFEDKDIVIKNFKLFDEDGNQITNTKLMDYSNDPNKKHKRYQFTLFPMKRLKWNHIYKVEINYFIDEKLKSLKWKFLTKSIDYPYYKIVNKKTTIKIKPNTYYALYIVPKNNNDIIKSWRYSKKKLSKLIIKHIDKNTLLINFSAKIGEKCTLRLSKSAKIILQVAKKDNAKTYIKKVIKN